MRIISNYENRGSGERTSSQRSTLAECLHYFRALVSFPSSSYALMTLIRHSSRHGNILRHEEEGRSTWEQAQTERWAGRPAVSGVSPFWSGGRTRRPPPAIFAATAASRSHSHTLYLASQAQRTLRHNRKYFHTNTKPCSTYYYSKKRIQMKGQDGINYRVRPTDTGDRSWPSPSSHYWIFFCLGTEPLTWNFWGLWRLKIFARGSYRLQRYPRPRRQT